MLFAASKAGRLKRAVSSYWRDERGGLTIFMLVSSAFTFGFVSLMLDIGRVFTEHTRLQHFVDSLAIAGAVELADRVSASSDPAAWTVRDPVRGVISVLRDRDPFKTRVTYGSSFAGAFSTKPVEILKSPIKIREQNLSDTQINALIAPNRATNDGEARYVLIIANPVEISLLHAPFLNMISGGSFTEILSVGSTTAALAQITIEEADDVELTVALDNSPSMLIGSGQYEIQQMINGGDFNGCAFACHFNLPGFDKSIALAGDLPPPAAPRPGPNGLNQRIELKLDTAARVIARAALISERNSARGGANFWLDVKTFADAQTTFGQAVVDVERGMLRGPADIPPLPPGQTPPPIDDILDEIFVGTRLRDDLDAAGLSGDLYFDREYLETIEPVTVFVNRDPREALNCRAIVDDALYQNCLEGRLTPGETPDPAVARTNFTESFAELTTIMSDKISRPFPRLDHSLVIITDGMNNVEGGGVRAMGFEDCGSLINLANAENFDVYVIWTTYFTSMQNPSFRQANRVLFGTGGSDPDNPVPSISEQAMSDFENPVRSQFEASLKECVTSDENYFRANDADDLNDAFEELLTRVGRRQAVRLVN